MIRRLLLALVVLVALVVGAVFLGIVKSYRIPSSSMEPTFHCARPGIGCSARFSDRVLGLKLVWPFSHVGRGDIVVFRATPRAARLCGVRGIFVKRVIALPGDTFAERRGAVVVNGRTLREGYVKRRDRQSYPRRRVPARSYFLLGDARSQSCDSRVWGPVPRGNLVARVVAGYWPPTRIGLR